MGRKVSANQCRPRIETKVREKIRHLPSYQNPNRKGGGTERDLK